MNSSMMIPHKTFANVFSGAKHTIVNMHTFLVHPEKRFQVSLLPQRLHL